MKKIINQFDLGCLLVLCWFIVALIILFLIWKDTAWLSNKILLIFYLSWYVIIFVAGYLIGQNRK